LTVNYCEACETCRHCAENGCIPIQQPEPLDLPEIDESLLDGSE
jgi:hypothetical protein